MNTTNLRKDGGSVMLTVPPALLDLLKIGAGTSVDIYIKNGRLIVEPSMCPRYTQEKLLAQCDENATYLAENRGWIIAKPDGKELL